MTGVPEKEEKEKRDRKLILRNNGWGLPKSEGRFGYPNSWMKAHKLPNKVNLRASSIRHIKIKILKIKDKDSI